MNDEKQSASKRASKNKTIISDLQTKNMVLNDEIKRLRSKLISMKQSTLGNSNVNTPSKMSIAERMKLRRRERGEKKRQK